MSPITFADAAERIKAGLDIVDIIQHHLPIKRSGRYYRGICPFHKDKSPSMDVSREKGLFVCRACGAGGDSLTFLMKIKNRSYSEIVRELAEDQGIEISTERSLDELERHEVRQKLLDLNQEAAQWFQDRFFEPAGQEAYNYLVKRYPSEEHRNQVQQQFKVGYAPESWENLTLFLKNKFDFVRSDPNLLLDASLSKFREKDSKYYDTFRHRLMIPIHDERGQVVGFGGRALSDTEKAKYLNSSETDLYKKSNVLYGLYQARNTINKQRSVVVMEGYFDVITAHVAGITESVASCGTAMTDSHLKLLTRFGAETVYLAFDSDEAGIKAALRAIHLIEPYINNYNLELKVLVVPNGKDPDEFIRQQGGDSFRNLMEEATHFVDFQLEMAIRNLPLQTSEGRIQAANRLTPLFAKIGESVKREEYIKQYSKRLNVSEEAMWLEVRRYRNDVLPDIRPARRETLFSQKKKAIYDNPSTSSKRQQSLIADSTLDLRFSKPPSRQDTAEKNLLKLTLYNPESFSLMMSVLAEKDSFYFDDPCRQEILEGLQNLAQNPLVQNTDPSANGFLGTLIEKMNHLYFDKPDVIHTFAELALTAETFGDSLGLGELQGVLFKEKVSTLAQQQISLLAGCQRMQQLQALKAHASQNEGKQVELTYQFQDRYLETARSQSTT